LKLNKPQPFIKLLQPFIQRLYVFEWLEPGDQRSQRIVILDFHVL